MDSEYVCPKITEKQLAIQCTELGIQLGDIVMVHASMKAVGEILGGPDVLIETLMAAVGQSGTLMSYAGCELPFDDVGRGIFSDEDECFIKENIPPFSPEKSRANRDHGIFAEFFRTHEGVVASRNPGSRMTARGAKATWLVDEHPYDFGLGIGSPLEKLCQAGGKVLLIGSDLDNVTLLHYAEAVAPIQDKRLSKIKVPLNIDGRKEWREMVEFDSSQGIRLWDDNFFSQIVRAFLACGQCQCGKLGNADSYLFDAARLVDFAVPIMVQTAAVMDKSVETSKNR